MIRSVLWAALLMMAHELGHARYIQPDPIGMQGGWNPFEYAGGNPLLLTDPEGLRPPQRGGNSHQNRVQQRAQEAAERMRLQQYLNQLAQQREWVKSYTRQNGEWGSYADGLGSVTGAGGEFRHPSVPNAVEWLISPIRKRSDEPFIPSAEPAQPEPPICKR